MKAFLYLYISSNKNYFFERFKFLNHANFKKIYIFKYFLKQLILIMSLLFIINSFKEYRDIAICIPFVLLCTQLIGIDSRKWMHYYRNDWLHAYPSDWNRFLALSIGNFLIDFGLENNIVVLFLFQSLFYNYITLIPIYLGVILLYFLLLSFQLVMIQSKLLIKKLYSMISYVVGCFLNVIISYWIFHGLIYFSIAAFQKRDLLKLILTGARTVIFQFIKWMTINGVSVLVLLTMGFIMNAFLIVWLIRKGYFRNGNQGTSASLEDLYIINKYYKTVSPLLGFKNLFKKELAMIVALYSFNYKEYFNTFFCDRPIFILLGILLNLVGLPNTNIYLVIVPLMSLFFYLDIYSGATAKLLANMSFVTDYNTLRILNSSGKNISDLISAKVSFFNIVRFPGYIAYVVLLVTFIIFFRISIIIGLLTLILLGTMWFLLPHIFITNNLIYYKSDYKSFNEYVGELNLLAEQSKEFFLMKIYYQFLFLWLFFTIIIVLIIKDSSLLHLLISMSSLFLLLFLVILAYIMKKVRENICRAIMRGDFSVDISKIFKKP